MVFLLAAAGCRGGGKVGILLLDFHFSTAHTSRFFSCLLFCLKHVRLAGAVEMWESRLPSARFPRGSWKEWEACLWLSTLSTAPAFPQLSFLPFFGFLAPTATSFALALAFRLLILLGVLHPVTRDVQLDDHAMMHQPVDRSRRHHRVFEDGFPLRERQIAGHQYAAAL